MTSLREWPRVPLQFFATAPYPCSYLEGRQARSLVAMPSEAVNARTYAELVQRGFRRSGSYVYRPHCDGCTHCVPLRVPVATFRPDRSQRRCRRTFARLQVRILPVAFHAEHYALYQRYQSTRHPGGGMDRDSVEQFTQFLLTSRVTSHLVEFREPGDGGSPGALRIVAVVDELPDGLSAVYTFYDPDVSGLGTCAVLWQIDAAARLDLPYVYLGYWIAASPKMAYKTAFGPHELLVDGRWVAAARRPQPSGALTADSRR